MRALTLALVLYAATAMGADTYKIFPLNAPLAEQIVVCLKPEPAVQFIKFAAKNDEAGADKLARTVMGTICGPVAGLVTYRKRIHLQDVDGVPYTVYQAEIDGVTVYVPMR